MSSLQTWEEKIKAKRMKTPFREFVKEIASWEQLNFYKNRWMISRYPESNRLRKLISWTDFFDSISDNANTKEYDWNQGFFENFHILFQNQYFPYLWQVGENENCSFSDTIYNAKNCYLSISTCFDAENIFYSCEVGNNSRNVLNSFTVFDGSDNIYFCSWIVRGFNIFFSKFINHSSDIWFSSNLIGCRECILCDNLKNQSYCINNEPLDKDIYMERKKRILKNKTAFLSYYENLKLEWSNTWSRNCSGLFCVNSVDVENGYFASYINTWRNIISIWWNENIKKEGLYDIVSSGSTIEDAFWCMWVSPWANFYCSMNSWICNNIYYSYYLVNCSFCLGCIGLKNKSYCILNKQYTKEEWYELADKIFAQMDKDGTLGNFFPWSMNPFYFNDTMAYLIDDTFTKEEVEKEGYMWRDEAIKVDIPEWADIIETKDLNKYQWVDTNGNWDIKEDILKKVIRDEKGNFYKIVPMELEFLRKHGLPLPEIHWLDRIKMGFRM